MSSIERCGDMDQLRCSELIKRLESDIKRNEARIENYGKRLDLIEQDIVGMKRDTSRLEDIMTKLEVAIENLNLAINELKYKPMRLYEQIGFGIINLLLGYLFARIIG